MTSREGYDMTTPTNGTGGVVLLDVLAGDGEFDTSILESGPPRLYRHGSLAHLRTVEEWIHHEDVRRGSGLPPRPMTSSFEAALWHAGTTIARFPEFRLGREGLELDAGDGRRLLVDDGHPARVRVSGPPGELLLYLAGRGPAAHVSVSGDEADIGSIQPGLRV